MKFQQIANIHKGNPTKATKERKVSVEYMPYTASKKNEYE